MKCPKKIEVFQLNLNNEKASPAKKKLECKVEGDDMTISRKSSKQCSPFFELEEGQDENIQPHPDVYMRLEYSLDDLNFEPASWHYQQMMGTAIDVATKPAHFELPTTTTTTVTDPPTTTKPKKSKAGKKSKLSLSIFGSKKKQGLFSFFKKKQSVSASFNEDDIWLTFPMKILVPSGFIILGLCIYVHRIQSMQEEFDIRQPLLSPTQII